MLHFSWTCFPCLYFGNFLSPRASAYLNSGAAADDGFTKVVGKKKGKQENMCTPFVNKVDTDREEAFKEKNREMRLLYEELVSAYQAVTATGINESAALSSSHSSLENDLGTYLTTFILIH